MIARATIPILMNPQAGAHKRPAGIEQMRTLAEAAGMRAEIISASDPEEMKTALRRLVGLGIERVGVAGGDGTIAKAVQVLAHTDTALGIIPQGTFNNFATALRLPIDLPSALRILAEGESREVSLGKIGDQYFTEAAGVGLFADALALYGRGSGKSLWRGLKATLKIFVAMRGRRMSLTLDGMVVQERAVWCTVANSYRFAQGLAIAPEASLLDEVLDVVILGDIRRLEFVRYYRAIRAQLHGSLPKLTMHRAKTVRIETRGKANVHADDEIVGSTPVTIEAAPRALKVLVESAPAASR